MFEDRQAHVVGVYVARAQVADHIRQEASRELPVAEAAGDRLLREEAVRDLQADERILGSPGTILQ